MVLWLLRHAGVQINDGQILARSLTSGVMATGLISNLRTPLVVPWPARLSQALSGQFVALQKRLGFVIHFEPRDSTKNGAELMAISYQPWPAASLAILPTLSSRDLQLLAQGLSPLDRERARVIEALLRQRTDAATMSWLQVQAFPSRFYDICESSTCALELRNQVLSFYSLAELRNIYWANLDDARRAPQLVLVGVNTETSPQAAHWSRLIQMLKPLVSRSN